MSTDLDQDNSHERNITLVRQLWLSKKYTLAQVHKKILSYYRFLYNENCTSLEKL